MSDGNLGGVVTSSDVGSADFAIVSSGPPIADGRTAVAAAEQPDRGGVEAPRARVRVPSVLLVGGIALATSLVMTFVISRRRKPRRHELRSLHVRQDGFERAWGRVSQGLARCSTGGPLYPIVLGGIFYVFGEQTGNARAQLLLVRRHRNVGLRSGKTALQPAHRADRRTALRLSPAVVAVHTNAPCRDDAHVSHHTARWCAYRFYRQPTVLNGGFVGVAAGLAALTKAVVILYPIVFVVAIYLSVRSARRRGTAKRTPWAAMAVLIASMALTLAPWTIRNYERTGHFVPVTTGAGRLVPRGFIFSRWEYCNVAGAAVHGSRKRQQYVSRFRRDGRRWGGGRRRDRPDPPRRSSSTARGGAGAGGAEDGCWTVHVLVSADDIEEFVAGRRSRRRRMVPRHRRVETGST